MHYAILAAGEGSRLRKDGVSTSKPLVKVNGETLAGRLIRIFLSLRAESIAVIINEEMADVKDWAQAQRLPVPFNLLMRSTAGSMLSLHALSPFIGGEKFIVSTVDAVFLEDEFASFVSHFEASADCHALMGVTEHVEDERPLYVATDDAMRVISFEDEPRGGIPHVSGGIYGLTPAVWPVLADCINAKCLRLREFQRELLRQGYCVRGYPFGKIIDLDNLSDIAKADEFLREAQGR